MKHDRFSLATQVSNRIGFLGELEDEMLAEAYIAAERAGLDLVAITRKILLGDEGRLTLAKAIRALEPPARPNSGQPKPWHLPTCECDGTRWVDAGTNDLGNSQVSECPHGGPISDAEWARYQAYEVTP